MINLRLAAYGTVVTPSRKALPFVTKESQKHIKGKRDVFFEEANGFVATTIYEVTTWKSEILPVAPVSLSSNTTTIIVSTGGGCRSKRVRRLPDYISVIRLSRGGTK